MIPLLTNSFRPPPCLFLRFLDFISYAFKWNWLIGKLSSSFVFTERLKNCYYSGRFRSSHQRCSETKVVLRNFAKLTGKHLCQSLCFNKVAGLRQDILYLLGCTWDKIEREILYLLGCLIPTFRFIFFRLTSIWFKNYANTSKKVFIQKRLLKISQVYSINQNLKNINSAK